MLRVWLHHRRYSSEGNLVCGIVVLLAVGTTVTHIGYGMGTGRRLIVAHMVHMVDSTGVHSG